MICQSLMVPLGRRATTMGRLWRRRCEEEKNLKKIAVKKKSKHGPLVSMSPPYNVFKSALLYMLVDHAVCTVQFYTGVTVPTRYTRTPYINCAPGVRLWWRPVSAYSVSIYPGLAVSAWQLHRQFVLKAHRMQDAIMH